MLQPILGQPSYRIASDLVEGWITRAGGQLAPVTFQLGSRQIQPFSMAPWAEESHPGQPPIIQALRGDFFCMPFGANQEPYQDESHPLHGETANNDWTLEAAEDGYLRLGLETTARPAKVVKELWLETGQTAIYCRHTISGGAGPMPLGHHAMLAFPPEEGSGLVSVSPFGFGQVFPGQFEDPKQGGYSCLRPGAQFQTLSEVPRSDGETADLSRYPAREGFEDLAIVYASDTDFAWSAVVFPSEGYLWFALKDPRTLSGTILWHSHGGRHYAPWSGRHRNVLGVEDVTAYMHYGLAGSAADNDAQRNGYKTYLTLDPEKPVVVNYIMGIAECPASFGHVAEIRRTPSGIEIVSSSGERVTVQVDTDRLYS